MKTLRSKPLPLLLLLPALAAAAACGRRDDIEHRVRNYDVVEEGNAGGVTTSLGGEQPGPVPSLTATNVDTTTDLAIIPGTGDTALAATAPPGSLADTLEIEPGAPPSRGMPPGAGRQPVTRPVDRTLPAAPAPRETSPAQPRRETPRETPPRETPTEPAPPQPPPEPPPQEQTPPPTSTTPTTTSTQPEEDPPPTNTAPPPQESPDRS